MLKVATWNLNSIRSRQERLLDWLARETPDVVCLQELKGTEAVFPFDALSDAGYAAAVNGQEQYNGVALLSRTTAEDVVRGLPGDDDAQARLIGARLGDVYVLCVYVPNGADVGSDKWAYKLAWLGRLRQFLDDRFTPADSILLCGDFNVAPDARDVAFPERWAESVLFHPDAREALTSLTDWGLVDTLRLHHDGPGPYSWWDYRHLAFPKNNGLRIDHVFATPPLADRCTDAYVDRDERKGPKPSDHAPVVAVFEA